MGDAFRSASKLGDIGEQIVMDGLSLMYQDVKGVPKNINHQMEWGDIVIPGVRHLGIPAIKYEVKAEAKHTGNVFWEWWSNREAGRKGWGQTSPADELFYLFMDTCVGYRFPALQILKWQVDYHKSDFKLVEQSKYDQDNDTWGYLIPIDWFRVDGVTQFDFRALKNPQP